MSAGLHRINLPEFARPASKWLHITLSHFKPSLVLLPAALAAGVAVWVLLPPSKGEVAEGKPVGLPISVRQGGPPPDEATPATSADVAVQAQSPGATSPEGLRISSQSWRRGGLGSKALVTFTLRNENDYAVKDVEILCSFSRRDGTHLTDRTRMLPDTVNMKSRKTFARVLVGHVNINANQAICSPVAARPL